MTRYRLVTTQNGGAPHVGTRVFGPGEINEELEAEALIHSLAGWQVERDGYTVTCRKKDVVRTIQVRESTPLDDKT